MTAPPAARAEAALGGGSGWERRRQAALAGPPLPILSTEPAFQSGVAALGARWGYLGGFAHRTGSRRWTTAAHIATTAMGWSFALLLLGRRAGSGNVGPRC